MNTSFFKHSHSSHSYPRIKLTDQLGMINQELNHKKTVDGVRYYEHPFHGDSAPLIVKHKGAWYYSREYAARV